MKKPLIRLLSFALAAVTLFSFAPRVAAADTPAGDMNGNGVVDSDDAIYLLRHVLFPGEYPLGDETEGRYRRGEVPLSAMRYEDPNFELAFWLIQNAAGSLETHEMSLEQMEERLNAAENMLLDCAEEEDILYFNLSCNVTSRPMQQQSAEFTGNFQEYKSKYYSLDAALIDDPVYGELFDEYSDIEKQMIKDYASSLDEEYVELSVRLNDLVMMYNDAYSHVVTVDRAEVAIGDIEDDYTRQYQYVTFCAEIYLDILATYKTLALKSGYDDVIDYMYDAEYYRDYTPDDVRLMTTHIKHHIAPLFKEAIKKYNGYSRNFDDVFEYDEQLASYFASIDPKMLEAYEYLKEFGLFYGTDSPDAQDGAYTAYIGKYDAPIIFETLSGYTDDLTTFIHEFGHFYNYYLHGASAAQQLDICEIHSQANELLFLPVYSVLFGKTPGGMLHDDNLILTMYYLIQASVFTEFELKAYEGSYVDAEELSLLFRAIVEEYGVEDYFASSLWADVIHFFEVPHYYVSYATSLVPALQIYSAFIRDGSAGIALYNQITEKGDYSASFLELLKEAGLDDPFSEETYADIEKMYKSQLGIE